MKVFWFDTETGGLDPEKNPILQLAYVVELHGKEVESGTLYSCGFEGCEISDAALDINGLTREHIADFPTEHEMYCRLMEIFTRYIDKYNKRDKFVAGGYNVQFDLNFLRALWARQADKYFGSWFAFGAVDPAPLMRVLQYANVVPEMTQMKLVDLAAYFGVLRPDAHDAFEDITMTTDVMKAIMERLNVSRS